MLIAILRLIRFPNLVVVAITQWLIANKVLGQAYQQENIAPILSSTELGLLIFATVSVAAIGYIVNDLRDLPIDLINRPHKVIIDNQISKAGAERLSYLIAVSGFIVTLFLAAEKGEYEWLWLYPLFVGLLLIYPKQLKRHHLAGNIFVAIACAATAGLIWLAERHSWTQLSEELSVQTGFLISLFMVYGFISTWIREIIKDLEDEEGDRVQGRSSIAISWGASNAKLVVYFLSIILSAGIVILLFTSIYLQLSLIGRLLAPTLVLCILLLSVLLHRANTSADYHRLSQFWKYYLLGGLTILICYQL